jgi:glucokinase
LASCGKLESITVNQDLLIRLKRGTMTAQLTLTRDSDNIIGVGTPVLAFDIGGTDIKAAIFDAAGRMLGLIRVATPLCGEGTSKAILDQIQLQASALMHAYPQIQPLAVGLIAPGIIDDDRGIGVHSANLNWSNVPFRALVAKRIGLPVSFAHDVRAAGEAELRLVADHAKRTVVVIVIGTGIGSALFIDGRAHVSGGYAGELGHSVVDPRGERCACGARGCLETIASAGGIARRYAEATTPTNSQDDTDSSGGARFVLDLARSGDPVALQIWEEALDALALAISQLTAVLAPDIVVIGGGLAQAGDVLFAPLRERVDALLSFHRRPQILPATLGENAGLLGAALQARSLVAQL